MKNPNRSDLYNEIVQNYENAEKKEWLAKRNPDAEKRFVMSFENKDAKETEMLFDGKKLMFLQDGIPVRWFDAVSGREGYQKSQYQNLANKGPIPEGTYDVKQDELSYYSFLPGSFWSHPVDNFFMIPNASINWFTTKALGGFGKFGKFPGGRGAWGNSKISLLPREGQEMYGRSGFTIHGGKRPGSAGCIDLTNQNDAFTDLFKKIGRDLKLTVKYRDDY